MIYEYTNYRLWLQTELNQRVADNPLFSANAFAKKLGVSQSYLSLVLNNQRSLTEKAALSIASKLKLNTNEVDYLTLLIKKEKTKDTLVKKYIDLEIKKFKRQNNVDEINLDKFRVISDWHYSALLELITIKNRSHTAKALAKRLAVNTETVVEALERLESLELIKKENNKYVRIDKGNLSTPSEIASLGLKSFHKQILNKAVKAVDEQNVADRVFSGLTMAINPEKLPEAKQMIENFKQELSTLLEVDEKSKVYQLSLQLFRLDIETED